MKVKTRHKNILRTPPHKLTGLELIRQARPTPKKSKDAFSSIVAAPIPQKNYKYKFKRIKDAPRNLYTCSNNGFLIGQNASLDHTYFKKVFCGREWCECCGADQSITHQRRISRAYPKIMSLDCVGYLVITVPAELRNDFMNKKILLKFKDYWKRKIKRDLGQKEKGQNKDMCGLIRYHWAGDDNKTFKPHLNILINNAWIETKQLETWRHELRAWFKTTFKLKGPKIPVANIYYQYTKEPGKIYHRLKYITRATLHKFESPELKNFFNIDMKNFKNTTVFGKFKNVAILQNDSQKIFNYNICPESNEPITWALFTTDLHKVVSKSFTTEKGLGIFHAHTCHTAIKGNQYVSNLGKQKKTKPIKLPEREPGQVFKDIYNADKRDYYLEHVFKIKESYNLTFSRK